MIFLLNNLTTPFLLWWGSLVVEPNIVVGSTKSTCPIGDLTLTRGTKRFCTYFWNIIEHESDCKLTLQNLPPHVIDSFVFHEHVTQNYSITFVWGIQLGEEANLGDVCTNCRGYMSVTPINISWCLGPLQAITQYR